MHIRTILLCAAMVSVSSCDKLPFGLSTPAEAPPSTDRAEINLEPLAVEEPTSSIAPLSIAPSSIAPCATPSCHALGSFDENIPHQVGELIGPNLVADGRDGFILFGPWASFEPGTYNLILQGTVEDPAEAYADVVSGTGTIVHAKIPLDNGEGTLVDAQVILSEPTADLEVRVYVSGASRLGLSGVTLRKSE